MQRHRQDEPGLHILTRSAASLRGQGVSLRAAPVILALACLLGGCAVSPWQTAIQDPLAPDVLESQLDEADRLAAQTHVDCLQHLQSAQALLDAAAGSPVFAFAVPLGPARLEAIEYRIHSARAQCAGAATRQDERRAALAAAQRAVVAYRDALDYQAMVIMQFKVAVTLRLLDENAAAVTELESALAWDREYGFDEDARENLRLLGLWQSQLPAVKAPVERSQRSVTLGFAWNSSDADVGLQVSFERYAGGEMLHTAASRAVQRRVRPSAEHGWLVSYEPGAVVEGEMSGLNETSLLRGLAMPVAQGLLELPDIVLTRSGDFDHVVDERHFAFELQIATQDLISKHAGGQEPSAADTQGLEVLFAPEVVAAQAEEAHNMLTAAWIGATLEQGVWYKTQAQLMLPGAGQLIAGHDVEFAFSHEVPCLEGAPEPVCVEILVHATPRRDEIMPSLHDLMRAQHLAGTLGYWSATYMRIVVDPASLTPYLRDERRYWYLSCTPQEGQERCDLNETVSERTLWRSSAPRSVMAPQDQVSPADTPTG